jgi:hypothetical protein
MDEVRKCLMIHNRMTVNDYQEGCGKMQPWVILMYSRLTSFTRLCITVLLIRRKIIVVIFVHHGIGLSLFHGRSCAGARRNTLQHASACKSQ